MQLAVPHVDDLLLAEHLVRAAPPTPPPLPDADAAGSIAFLFLVKDKLDYAEVWQRFFQGADPAHYGVYFHFFDTRYVFLPRSAGPGLLAHCLSHVVTACSLRMQ